MGVKVQRVRRPWGHCVSRVQRVHKVQKVQRVVVAPMGHAFGVRVQKVQKVLPAFSVRVQKVEVAAAPQFYSRRRRLI